MIASVIILAAQFNCVQPTPPTYHGNWYDDYGSVDAHTIRYNYERDLLKYIECLERNNEAERIKGTPWLGDGT